MPSTAEASRSTSRRPTAATTVNAYASFQNIGPQELLRQQAGSSTPTARTHDLTLADGHAVCPCLPTNCCFMPAELTLGTEYSYDDLSDDDSIGYDHPHRRRRCTSSGPISRTNGRPEKWSLLIGGRLDKHNLVDHAIFSPRANVRFNPSESVEPACELCRGLPRPAGLRRGHAHRHRGRQAGPHPACRRSEGGALAQREPLGRPLPHVSAGCRPTCSSRDSTPVSTTCSPCATSRTRPTAAKSRSVTTVRAPRVRGLNAEGRAVFTRWFELQAGVTVAAEPLCRDLNTGARIRTVRSRCAGCSARPICTVISRRR